QREIISRWNRGSRRGSTQHDLSVRLKGNADRSIGAAFAKIGGHLPLRPKCSVQRPAGRVAGEGKINIARGRTRSAAGDNCAVRLNDNSVRNIGGAEIGRGLTGAIERGIKATIAIVPDHGHIRATVRANGLAGRYDLSIILHGHGMGGAAGAGRSDHDAARAEGRVQGAAGWEGAVLKGLEAGTKRLRAIE